MFFRSCLWLPVGQGLSFCLSLAKGNRRWPVQLAGCLFRRSCLWLLAGQGLSFCLSLAKSNQRWPVQLAGCFFFGLASGSLRARGFSFAFGSQKANSVGLYSSPGAFSSVLSLAPCGPGAFLLPFTRQRQAAPVFAVSPVPFEALYAGLFSISKQQTGSALFSPKSAPPHSGLSKSGYNKKRTV